MVQQNENNVFIQNSELTACFGVLHHIVEFKAMYWTNNFKIVEPINGMLIKTIWKRVSKEADENLRVTQNALCVLFAAISEKGQLRKYFAKAGDEDLYLSALRGLEKERCQESVCFASEEDWATYMF